MTLDIQLRLGHEWTFEDLPGRSIALDGAVQGPRIDAENQRFSFDHHAGCLRLVTTATCQQVFDALLLGLDPTGMQILVNDLDGDTVLSMWLMEHYRRWRDPVQRERVGALVRLVALADAHGPAYPLSDVARYQHFNRHVMGATYDARARGFPATAMHELSEVFRRLDEWWAQGLVATEVAPPPHLPPPQVVSKAGDWVIVLYPDDPEIGKSFGPPWLYEKGYSRLVLATPLPDGLHHYTLAKRSDLVSGFPLRAAYVALNTAEGLAIGRPQEPGETWGGGSSIGGGPRLGSRLSPDSVAEVMQSVVDGARPPSPRP